MKLEDQVTSLELSQKLKELGVKQKSVLYWTRFDTDGNDIILHSSPDAIGGVGDRKISSAFTVAELGEMLPTKILGANGKDAYLELLKIDFGGNWETAYSEIGERCTVSPIRDWSEANARAKMLIYLIENKLIHL